MAKPRMRRSNGRRDGTGRDSGRRSLTSNQAPVRSTRNARRDKPPPSHAASNKLIRKGIAVSAGGVVWREASANGEFEVVLVQTPAMRWSLPKGTPENGEHLADTALREVSEETGLEVSLDEKIGVMRYSFPGEDARIDKAVHFWLMQPTGGSFANHDHEHVDVRWVGLGRAMRMVSYRNTVEVLEDAAALLDRKHGLLAH